MIFQNIESHNVAEIEQTEGGYKMWRLPSSVRTCINKSAAKVSSAFSTGIELIVSRWSEIMK